MLYDSLTCSSYISMLKAKLSRANNLLAKLRNYTSNKLLTTTQCFFCVTHEIRLSNLGTNQETACNSCCELTRKDCENNQL